MKLQSKLVSTAGSYSVALVRQLNQLVKKIQLGHHCLCFAPALPVQIHDLMGDSRKYPFPTMDGFRILTPPHHAFRNSKMHYHPCPQKSKLVNPPPLQNFRFFIKPFETNRNSHAFPSPPKYSAYKNENERLVLAHD